MQKCAVVYIHGKGGNIEEAQWYRKHFPNADVIGMDYQSQTPQEAETEFQSYFAALHNEYDWIAVIANSIGACFTLYSLDDSLIDRAFFISPIVNMERLITDMLLWAGATQEMLREKGTIETNFGETLSWKYLCWIREHPVQWNVRTSVLYGSCDNMQSFDTIRMFAEQTGADVTVMENGEHWFHTDEQMAFLDAWLKRALSEEQ